MEYLEKTFRWFGPDFGVSLEDIRQTGATGVVTALHKIPTGEVWGNSEIREHKQLIESAGLKWSVVESVNVHESIKTATEGHGNHINNYIETLHNLAANGITLVCYNFMPVLDWTRTDLNYALGNGKFTLKFDPLAVAAFDLYILQRKQANEEYCDATKHKAKAFLNEMSNEQVTLLTNTIMAGLPGTRDVFSLDEFNEHLKQYSTINEDQLRKNLANFLRNVIPEAEELGVRMAIHPDDPPYSLFGLPRVVRNLSDIRYVLDCVPSYANGLTYCTGSLGAHRDNDLLKIFHAFARRIHFLHLRSVQLLDDNSFYEADHLEGSVPMAEIMAAIIQEQVRRSTRGDKHSSIPMRPDHGHLMLNDIALKEKFYPGYSTIGRMKGLAELSGLEAGLRHLSYPLVEKAN